MSMASRRGLEARPTRAPTPRTPRRAVSPRGCQTPAPPGRRRSTRCRGARRSTSSRRRAPPHWPNARAAARRPTTTRSPTARPSRRSRVGGRRPRPSDSRPQRARAGLAAATPADVLVGHAHAGAESPCAVARRRRPKRARRLLQNRRCCSGERVAESFVRTTRRKENDRRMGSLDVKKPLGGRRGPSRTGSTLRQSQDGGTRRAIEDSAFDPSFGDNERGDALRRGRRSAAIRGATAPGAAAASARTSRVRRRRRAPDAYARILGYRGAYARRRRRAGGSTRARARRRSRASAAASAAASRLDDVRAAPASSPGWRGAASAMAQRKLRDAVAAGRSRCSARPPPPPPPPSPPPRRPPGRPRRALAGPTHADGAVRASCGRRSPAPEASCRAAKSTCARERSRARYETAGRPAIGRRGGRPAPPPLAEAERSTQARAGGAVAWWTRGGVGSRRRRRRSAGARAAILDAAPNRDGPSRRWRLVQSPPDRARPPGRRGDASSSGRPGGLLK